MSRFKFCDGVRRRDFLKAGALAGMGIGLDLAGYERLARAGAVSGRAKAKSAIYIRLGGGPTHMDTFDLKPEAPEEYRGQLKPIDTNVPGMQISEWLPKLARCADKYAILRGVSHTLAAHELGTDYMNTGNRPLPSLVFPGFGAVISKELPSDPDLPSFVAIPNTPQSGGYLGLEYGPLNTNSTPRLGQAFNVRGISLGGGLTVSDVDRREQLLANVDTAFRGYEKQIGLLSGLDQFADQAYAMISSKRAREAFDLTKESPEVAERFGNHDFGQSCLLATRLIESGVRFATVNNQRWDMHRDIFKNLETALPMIDDGLSALFTSLDERGLLDSTVVMVSGEFGRTPKINENAGRDHWPRAMFVLMAGGGIRGGQVLGASDEKGMGPAGDAIVPDAIAATYFNCLGIDHQHEYHTTTGRPVMIVRDGSPIRELLA